MCQCALRAAHIPILAPLPPAQRGHRTAANISLAGEAPPATVTRRRTVCSSTPRCGARLTAASACRTSSTLNTTGGLCLSCARRTSPHRPNQPPLLVAPTPSYKKLDPAQRNGYAGAGTPFLIRQVQKIRPQLPGLIFSGDLPMYRTLNCVPACRYVSCVHFRHAAQLHLFQHASVAVTGP